ARALSRRSRGSGAPPKKGVAAGPRSREHTTGGPPGARRMRRREAHPGAAPRCEVRVGVSGWRYPPWRAVFYPRGLPQKDELHYASRRLRTIEINGSFYSLQRPSSYLAWYAATPSDFLFAVKGARFITHNKKLVDCE